jgi:hypothetical protein
MPIKMAILPVDHHADYRIKHIVYILGKNVANYEHMPHGLITMQS